MRRIIVVIAFGLAATACGGAELSLPEYVEELNRLTENARRQAENITDPGILFAEGQRFLEYSPQDLQLALEEVGEIELELLEAAGGMNPPAAMIDLHRLWFNTKFTAARVAVAEAAGQAESWQELSATPEMAAYREALASDKQVCLDFQGQLDATAARGVFVDVPWLPSELSEAVEAALGCEWWPQNPEDMYRP